MQRVVQNLTASEEVVAHGNDAVAFLKKKKKRKKSTSTAEEPRPSTSGRAFERTLPRDFTLVLKGEHKLPVSSEVLCWNSPVFTRIIEELELTSHEMDDFEHDAVEFFVECLYTGISKTLHASIFREIYKMTHVFSISWLAGQCINFFEDLLKNEFELYSHFLFWEADYAFKCRNDCRLIELIENAAFEFGEPERFIGIVVNCHEDLDNASSASLELMKEVVKKQVEILARLVQRCVMESKCLSRNVKFLLDPVILARCLIRDSATYFSLFDTLQGLETLSFEDMKFISKIQLEISRRTSNLVIDKPMKAVDLRIPDPICSRTNHYFSQKLKEINNYQGFIKLFCETSIIKNLYMFIDGLYFWLYFHCPKQAPNWSKEIKAELVAIRSERRWKKVSHEYLRSLISGSKSEFAGHKFILSLSKCSELVCIDKNPLVADRFVSAVKLFNEPQVITFNREALKFSVKSTPLTMYDRAAPDIIFEFVPNDVGDFKKITASGETIYPQQMHLSFSVTGKTKISEYENWTPVPPLTWCSGLRCYSNQREGDTVTRFCVRWKEYRRNYDVDGQIPLADETFHGYFKLAFNLYF